MLSQDNQYITVQELCNCLDISKSSIYYEKKLPKKDLKLSKQIIDVINKNKTYGHRRVALELNINKKRVLRVMRLFNIKPLITRSKKPRYKYKKGESRFENLIKTICPIRPYVILATDFTYLRFKNSFLYLATVLDIYTKEILGYAVSTRHTQNLVLEAVKYGLSKCKTLPLFIHSDEGSEYMSDAYINYVHSQNIELSTSDIASPWQNGFKESFYSQFKLDLGAKNLNRFDTLGEVVGHIYKTIYYHNNQRIHTTIKTQPVKFRNQELAKWSDVCCDRLVSKKMGT
ncbi:IS3 family transposase [candidate division WWE3 bacterium]|nr:IS3 family transposase [candidate division WWE3 bacterium]